MKKKHTFISCIVLITISTNILGREIKNKINGEDSYYRTGVVVTDTLKLSESTILLKGDFVQIILALIAENSFPYTTKVTCLIPKRTTFFEL